MLSRFRDTGACGHGGVVLHAHAPRRRPRSGAVSGAHGAAGARLQLTHGRVDDRPGTGRTSAVCLRSPAVALAAPPPAAAALRRIAGPRVPPKKLTIRREEPTEVQSRGGEEAGRESTRLSPEGDLHDRKAIAPDAPLPTVARPRHHGLRR